MSGKETDPGLMKERRRTKRSRFFLADEEMRGCKGVKTLLQNGREEKQQINK